MTYTITVQIDRIVLHEMPPMVRRAAVRAELSKAIEAEVAKALGFTAPAGDGHQQRVRASTTQKQSWTSSMVQPVSESVARTVAEVHA